MNTGVLKITNSTVSSNSASLSSNGIYNCGAMTLVNSVLANSSGKDYCSASATSDSHHNLIADANNSCGFTDGVNDNIVGKDPRLGPLQDNGGPTQTHALLAGSPAFDTASAADCPSTDQRGEERPQDAGCDIGAYERKQPDPDSTAPTANPSQSPAAADSTRMPARPAAHPAARARSR